MDRSPLRQVAPEIKACSHLTFSKDKAEYPFRVTGFAVSREASRPGRRILFEMLLKTRLDWGLFLVATLLSAITLTTGAVAVHADDARGRAESYAVPAAADPGAGA